MPVGFFFSRIYCACGLVYDYVFILHAGLFKRICCACGLVYVVLVFSLLTRFYCACGLDYEILLCLRACLCDS